MKKTGEILARVCICLLTGATVFAFGGLLYGARHYQAAGAGVAVAPASARASRAVGGITHHPAVPRPANTALRQNALMALRQREAELQSGAETEVQAEAEDAPLEAAPAAEAPSAEENAVPAPAKDLHPINAETLQAELERMAALGFEVAAGTPGEAPYEKYMGTFHATAYCAEVYPHICGGNGVTASGTVPTPGLTVATDWGLLPPGTWLYIGGVGVRRVEDSGSAIKEYRLDVNVDTHQNALAWPGYGRHEVWVLAWPPGYEPPDETLLASQDKQPLG